MPGRIYDGSDLLMQASYSLQDGRTITRETVNWAETQRRLDRMPESQEREAELRRNAGGWRDLIFAALGLEGAMCAPSPTDTRTFDYTQIYNEEFITNEDIQVPESHGRQRRVSLSSSGGLGSVRRDEEPIKPIRRRLPR